MRMPYWFEGLFLISSTFFVLLFYSIFLRFIFFTCKMLKFSDLSK